MRWLWAWLWGRARPLRIWYSGISCTEIGDEGARGIAHGIAKSRSLKHIDLSSCQIGAEGAFAVGRALGESKSVGALFIQKNSIGKKGMLGIADGLVRSKTFLGLSLSTGGKGSSAGLLAVFLAIKQSPNCGTFRLEHHSKNQRIGSTKTSSVIGQTRGETKTRCWPLGWGLIRGSEAGARRRRREGVCAIATGNLLRLVGAAYLGR